MAIKTPCLPDCPGRSAECHAHCETYLAAYRANLERYARGEEARRAEDIISHGISARLKQMRRKKAQR